MQIHELNNYSGSLGDAYLVADNGSDTGKIKTTALTNPLNERIDNIIAGPAPSAAEIVDARLGAESLGSERYATLGDAIRGQVDMLRAPLNSFFGNEEKYTGFSWELGTINSTTGENRDDTTRVRTDGYIPTENIVNIRFSSKRINVFYYTNDSGSYISFTGWIDNPGELNKADIPSSAKYLRIVYLATSGAENDVIITVKTTLGEWDEFLEQFSGNTSRFGNKFQSIAYSKLNNTIINTKEHFVYCARNGFDGLKCDVQLTSDDKLILCHDAGFTFDANGRITSYSASSNTLIHNMTFNEIISLEYAQQFEGAYVHPTDLETFLVVCKRYGKIPYITVRSDYIDTIAPLVIELLAKYELTMSCIINSFEYSSLMVFRQLEPKIYLSEVFAPQNNTLFNNALTHARANNNYMLCLFYSSYAGQEYSVDWFENNTVVLNHLTEMKTEGIQYYGAQTSQDSDIDALIRLGFSGTQHKAQLL